MIFKELNKLYNSKHRKVLQIHPISCQIIGLYKSCTEAGKILNMSDSNIIACCNYKVRHSNGYIWRYFDEFFNNYYVRAYNYLNNNFQYDPIDFYTGNLLNYIEPSFHLLPGEEFRDIEGYEGLYQVSNFGRVISLHNKPYIYELKNTLNKFGYLYIKLCDINHIGTKFLIHRLVAKAFIPNPNNLPMINHKNEIKINNCVNNLEWCDAKYNVNYGSGSIRINTMMSPILQINPETNKIISEFKSITDAKEFLGLTYPSHISRAISGKIPTAYGFKWIKKEE